MLKEFLRNVPLFNGLTQEQLEGLQDISNRLSLNGEKLIFSQGDQANGFYLIYSGQVKVFKLSWEGKEQILHIFEEGEPIGEVPVFSGTTFPASAQTLEKTELIFLPRDKLRDLFQQDPSLAMNMLAVLAQRLRNFTELIGDLALKEISQRLATYLLYMQTSQRRNDKINLAVSKGTLSKILGTTQETLSRVLKKMKHAGIIEINNKEINILDLEFIKDLSEGIQSL